MENLNNLFSSSLEKIAYTIFEKIKFGNLRVIFPSKKIINFNGKNSGVCADINLHNFLVIGKFIKKGPIGFAESYMDCDFSTNDLTKLLIFLKMNESTYIDYIKGKLFYKMLRKIYHYFNENTKSKSQKNISYHYDLGNNFYELWLDETMTYSSGLFNTEKDNLLEAQMNKYKKITDSIKSQKHSSLLEIGCGWGSFTTYVAKNLESKITAITNSKKHFEYTSKKVFNESLNEKVNIQFKDYREINEKYDNIISIEMFEAVGIKYWPIYFEKIKKCLNNNGSALIQTITIDDYRASFYQKNPDFIQQYIFPGGVLASKKQLYEITSSLGLELSETVSFGKSYAKTLNMWNNKFQNSWNRISKQGFSMRFKKMWEYYLSYCEAGFLTKTTDVSQFLIKF